MKIVLISVVVLAAIGIVAAVLLYIVSQRFKVEEDPMIDKVAALLPGANCGGCGFAGCRNFAENVVKSGGPHGFRCPGGGAAVNSAIAQLFGVECEEGPALRMVLKCNGTCSNAPAKVHYDAIKTCAFENMITAGNNGCAYGCLGCGDCVRACSFGGITIGEDGLPHINHSMCTRCQACAKACPRGLIVAVPVVNNKVVWVACNNKDKGAEAKKNCSAACIGCMKCTKVCEHEAVTVENNLAEINNKCVSCGTCADNCVMKSIHVMEVDA